VKFVRVKTKKPISIKNVSEGEEGHPLKAKVPGLEM
jgi:hypothetical protein